jgi:hypothetical protein
MRSTVSALGDKMGALKAGLKDGQKEMVACQETTEAFLECKEPTSKEMESEVAEHEEVPMESAVAKPVGGWKKRPEHCCRATRKAEETDPRRLWIPGDVGCRLQERGCNRYHNDINYTNLNELELKSLNCSYKTKITFKYFRARRQVIWSGLACLVREEGVLTAIQRNTIRILRKIPNVQVTLISKITWGL